MSAGLRLLASVAENGSTTTFRLIDNDLLVDDEEVGVLAFMRNHYRRYGELPLVETIEAETDTRLPETPEHVDYYLQEVHDRHVYTNVRDEFGPLRTAITDRDIPGMLSSANSIRRICTPFSGQQQELQTLAELTDEVRAEYAHQHAAPGFSGIPTGWDYLDEETGGYQNGDLVVWVARPSIGKTHMLIHASRTAWMAQKSVLFVSMEMTLPQIAMRFSAHHGNVDPEMVRKGKLSNWAKRRFDDSLVSMGDAHNFHLFAGNFNKTADDVDILIQELEPDAIYIDGMYLMTPSTGNSRMGRYEKAAYLTDDLKRMTLTRHRPIIATTQFGKGAGKDGKAGNLENIGYTDAIPTHASIIVATKIAVKQQRDIIGYEYDEEHEDYQLTTIGTEEYTPSRYNEVLKGREGESGAFGCSFAFGPTNFGELPISEVTSPEDEQAQRPDMDYMS